MKLYLTILLLAIAISGKSQYSLSAGITRLHEGIDKDLTNYFGKSREQLYLQDYVSVRCNYMRSNIGFWVDVMFLPGKAAIKQTEETSSGGGSSPAKTYRYDYYSTFEYNYLALKIGFDYRLNSAKDSLRMNKKWKNHFFISPYLQVDALMSYKESDHKTIYTVGFAAYDQGNYLGYYNYTEYPATYDQFNGVKAYYVYQTGLEFRWRLSFKNYFFESGITFSSWFNSDLHRTKLLKSDNYSEYQKSIVNVSSFIKVGYEF